MNQPSSSALNRSRSSGRNWVLAAAVAAVPLLGALAAPSTAYAQFPSGNDGRARDANPRVGSNGFNDSGVNVDRRGRIYHSGNRIITGNVTRGQHFRGAVDYGDPREFRGATGSRLSDRFIRDSAGAFDAPTAGRDSFTPSAYYGRSRAVPPPPGTSALGATGGYVGRTPGLLGESGTDLDAYGRYGTTSSVYARENPFSRANEDLVLQIPVAGQQQAGGTAGAVNAPLVVTASPLYGVRRFGPDDRAAGDFLSSRQQANQRNPFGLGMDDASVQRMRDELNQTDLATGRRDPNARRDGDRPDEQPARPGAAPEANNQLPQPPGVPATPAPGINQGFDRGRNPQGTDVPPAQQGNNSFQTGQGLRHRLLVPPAQQTAQYAQMRRRFEQLNASGQVTDADRMRQFNALRRAQETGQPPTAEPGATGIARTPGAAAAGTDAAAGTTADRGAGIRRGAGAGATGEAGPRVVPSPAPARAGTDHGSPATGEAVTVTPAERPTPGQRPEVPVQVKSLAEGVQAQGLRELLKSAEDLLKEGKYDSAIEKYESAERVALNNPLISLGRAHAELAATYYRRAENTLRRAVEADPALLYGQYDLRGFIGQDRLQYVANDLKELAAGSPKDPRPVLLLAYITYNSQMEQQAATFLDEASRRAGPQDPTIALLRKHWSLPARQEAEQGDENK